MSLPTRLPLPMLATAGALPDLGDPPAWATEFKWDGIRVAIGVDASRCVIMSRNGNDLSSAFPEVCAAMQELAGGRELIVDGEIVATEAGVPQFSRIQRRVHVRRPSRRLQLEVPAQAFLFDALVIDGVEVMEQPYQDRRERLLDLELSGPGVLSPPHWLLPAAQVLEVAAAHALEGVVVKRLGSIYQPGARSPAWRKVALAKTTEVIVVGALPSSSSRLRGEFGSLLIAAQAPDGELVLLGAVGSGVSAAERRRLAPQLERLAIPQSVLTDPPRWAASARWCYPVLVGEVRYKVRTANGLRHPVWLGLRVDRDPSSVWLPPD